ncbi:hypothetical protein HA49_01620 [Tatumella morbirosei]|uniref:Prophage protein n=1 Tax=Tatumella morbirosei TaxID=642227 RepID=A0A095TS83_9GAMM|nr:hypothetical protein [Tatumella morbirosei]KGD79696.1 hypothetical protein HA49_01620 [Tatumella morbirosei]
MTIQLVDAACQVEQAEAVLSMWLEFTSDKEEASKIGAILTLLYGVYQAIDRANQEISDLKHPQLKERRA